MPIPNLDHALSAAMRTVDVAVQHVLQHQPTSIMSKGDRDLVTNIDLAVEGLVRGLLYDWDPEIGFLGEEHGAFGDQNTYWVLDPVDGTINFAHGSPLCAIALALVHDHHPVLGVTALPFLRRRYWAVQGGGAYRDGETISVSITATLDEAVIGMCDYGSGPDAAIRDPLCVHVDRQLTGRAQGVRRLGTTALELVWVADGSLDASILFGNRTWDNRLRGDHRPRSRCAPPRRRRQPAFHQARCTLATTPALAKTLLSMMDIARDTPYWPEPAGTP